MVFIINQGKKIEFVCQSYVSQHGSVVNNQFILKLAGDGASLNKKGITILNFVFTLIHDREKPKSVHGNYLLGVFEIEKENYINVKRSLEDLLFELKEVQQNGIIVNKIKHDIKFILGGDLKFLSIVLGIVSATGNHSCPWCHTKITGTLKFDDVWPISRTQELASQAFNDKDTSIGYINLPIIDFIDFNNCQIDLLHLLLRITDKIFEFLIEKLNAYDNNRTSFILSDRPALNHFFKILKEKCRISKPFIINEKNKIIKLRSFNGNERWKIFTTICGENQKLSEFFINEENQERRQSLFDGLDLETYDNVWYNFYEIYTIIMTFEQRPHPSIESLKKRLLEWLGFFMRINTGNLTPYVHAFVYHIPELIERHGDLSLYSLQGLEKLNDFTILILPKYIILDQLTRKN